MEDPASLEDGIVAERVGKHLGISVDYIDFCSEGGDREFNGKGVMITCEAVELQRNPHLTREQLDIELKKIFNLRKIIWLKRGLAEDEQSFSRVLPGGYFTCFGTGGHVDEFVRFADTRTILLAEVSIEDYEASKGCVCPCSRCIKLTGKTAIESSNIIESDDLVCCTCPVALSHIALLSAQRLNECLMVLQSETDQDDEPWKIVRIPVPPLMCFSNARNIERSDNRNNTTEDIMPGACSPLEGLLRQLRKDMDNKSSNLLLPVSYCNFLISNNIVLAAKYYQPNIPGRDSPRLRATDEAAYYVLQCVFPSRQVMQLDVDAINFGGGGIHCITQQQPA